jgi:hypothetical protein
MLFNRGNYFHLGRMLDPSDTFLIKQRALSYLNSIARSASAADLKIFSRDRFGIPYPVVHLFDGKKDIVVYTDILCVTSGRYEIDSRYEFSYILAQSARKYTMIVAVIASLPQPIAEEIADEFTIAPEICSAMYRRGPIDFLERT